MAQSAGLQEDAEKLKPETRDRHRAIVSIMEELEAVDWYDQRVDAASDDELRAILRTIATRRRSTPRWCSSGCAAVTAISTSSFEINLTAS